MRHKGIIKKDHYKACDNTAKTLCFAYILNIYNFLRVCKHVGKYWKRIHKKSSYCTGVGNTFCPHFLSSQFLLTLYKCSIFLVIIDLLISKHIWLVQEPFYEKSVSLEPPGTCLHFLWSPPGSARKALSRLTRQSVWTAPSPLKKWRDLPFWASDWWRYCNICTRRTWEWMQRVWPRSLLPLTSPPRNWTRLHWLCQRAHPQLSWGEACEEAVTELPCALDWDGVQLLTGGVQYVTSNWDISSTKWLSSNQLGVNIVVGSKKGKF